MLNIKKNDGLNLLFKNLDVVSALSAFIMGILIVFVSFFTSVNQHLIGFALITIALIYIIFADKLNTFSYKTINISYNKKLLLDILFFILYSISLIILFSETYKRPTSYFILIGLLSGLIATNILYSNQKRDIYLVIFKIFLLSINIRYGVFFIFPSIMGYDAYTHVYLMNLISENGFLPSHDVFGKYYYYPIFHIFISVSQILFGLDPKNSVFFSIGLISIFITLFVYLIGKNIGGIQVGLIAMLLLNLIHFSIVGGIANITPGSLVFCYFLIILYIVFSKNINTLKIALLLFITALILITHQLTTFTVILSLTIIYLSYNFYVQVKNEKKTSLISFNYLILFVVSVQAYWMVTYVYQNVTFFEYVFRPLISVLQSGTEYGSNVLVVGNEYDRSFIKTLSIQLSYLILPFFGIGGTFMALSKYTNNKKFTIAITFGFLFALSYIIPLIGMRNLLTHRWMPIIYIFLILLASFFILKIIDELKPMSIKVLVTYALIFTITVFMILTPAINKDNPILDDYTTRNQYTHSEIYAAQTVSNVALNEILTDVSYAQCFSFYSSNSNLTRNYFTLDHLERTKPITLEDKSLVVIRKTALREPVSVKYGDLYGLSMAIHFPIEFVQMFDSQEYNLVYNNNNIIVYN
jgi:4-amino-4-deoxy-L-arabinose transferase-like glycosyltransferase